MVFVVVVVVVVDVVVVDAVVVAAVDDAIVVDAVDDAIVVDWEDQFRCVLLHERRRVVFHSFLYCTICSCVEIFHVVIHRCCVIEDIV